jgi:predicted nucleic acid-binding protein
LTATILDFFAPLPAALYWDASFIVSFSHADSPFYKECTAFVTRLRSTDTPCYVSALALDEVWFALLQLFILRDYAPRKFWKVYEQEPAVILPYLDRLEKITSEIYQEPQVRVLGVTSHSPIDALENMRQFHLLPRDAMHLAIMRQHQITAIVTLDADFQSVEGISIFTCNPNLLNDSNQA